MERAAEAFGAYLAAQLRLDQDRQEIVAYGALTFMQNGASLLLMIALGWLVGALPETLVALLAAASMRHASGGTHLSTPMRCVVVTGSLFALCGYAGGVLGGFLAGPPAVVRAVVELLPLAGGMGAVYRYAPVEAENRRLSRAHRAKLRRLSLRLALVLAAAVILGVAVGAWWVMPALAGFLTECFTLTPTGHRMAGSLDRFCDAVSGREV